MADRLERYREMRDFTITPEPRGHRAAPKKAKRLRYYLQRHAATRLHYDLRLDPAEKRPAMQTEDPPLEYGEFEGLIPGKQYGAGEVLLCDKGVCLGADAYSAGVTPRRSARRA